MRAQRIRMHCEPRLADEIDAAGVARFTSECFASATVTMTTEQSAGSSAAGRIVLDPKDPAVAAARIFDIDRPPSGRGAAVRAGKKPYDYKERAVYDGFDLCGVAEHMLGVQEQMSARFTQDGVGALDILFANLLACTYDDNDCRYHARMIMGANPVIISVPGIVEAPARPRGYYIDKMIDGAVAGAAGRGIGADMRKKYDYIERNDPRMPDVAMGLAMQAVMYYETGVAFCADRACRMYNSHWQSDLIRTQVTEPALCDEHKKVMGLISGT